MGIWKKMAGLVLAAVVLLGLGFAAGQASAAPKKKAYQPIDAKALIAACWEISKERRDEGSTSAMRSGTGQTVQCLQDEILLNGLAMFKDKAEREAKFKDYIERISFGVQRIYWEIYNDNSMCNPSCGTMFTVFHLWRYSDILEKILDDIVDQRNRYEL